MLQVGNLQAKPGEKTFGYLETAQSRSGMRLDIPVHLIAGAEPRTHPDAARRDPRR